MSYEGFDHIHWWVGNAKQSADWFVGRFGFRHVGYKGLETGCRTHSSHVVRQGDIFFVFSSPLGTEDSTDLGQDINHHLAKHGDGVKDIAFAVTDARGIHDDAVAMGAVSVREPTEVVDEYGTVIIATIQAFGDTVHSFVQRGAYRGPFLPGYREVTTIDPFSTLTPPVGLSLVDHAVGNQPDKSMTPVVDWYGHVLKFGRFWTVDDTILCTATSALNFTVITDPSERIKLVINEPSSSKRGKSQIQEFVDHYGGAGVQHVALLTDDIITAVTHLRARGVEFLSVPSSYYDALDERLGSSCIKIKEDLEKIKELNVLVDFDESGYLLQLFSKPIMDRPTVFLEIIQRAGNTGFGIGNIRSLFEAIEREQAKRGNL